MEQWQITPEIAGRNPMLRHAIVQAMDAVRQGQHLLIEGEGGSGRRLLARSAWARHGRGESTMLTVDCQMFGAQAVESLLFGEASRRSHIHESLTVPLSGGLLLVRAEALPPHTQHRLGAALRRNAIVEGPLRLQVILVSTALPPSAADLALTPGMVRVWIPPLRQRPEDIPTLVEFFLHQISPYHKVRCSNELMERLCAYSWPDNVAELRTVLRRLLMQAHRNFLDVEHLISLASQDGRGLGLIQGELPAPHVPPAVNCVDERRLP